MSTRTRQTFDELSELAQCKKRLDHQTVFNSKQGLILKQAKLRIEFLEERYKAAKAILDELLSYNVGLSFLSEEKIEPLWAKWCKLLERK